MRSCGVRCGRVYGVRMDEWKRQRLLGADAEVVIPDYRDADALLDLLMES